MEIVVPLFKPSTTIFYFNFFEHQKVLFLSVNVQTSLKVKFKQGLNHLTGLNGFKPGHCSTDPHVSAFPLPCFLPTQCDNARRLTPPRPGRCRRPTLSLRASHASPFPPFFPPPPGVRLDPPSPFFPLSTSA
jgi:hypothetical protein